MYGLGRMRNYGFDVHVMRVRTATVNRRAPRISDWQVRTKRGWRTAATYKATNLLLVGESFSNVFSVVAVQGKMYAVVKTYELLGESIDLYRAKSVQTPFRLRQSLTTIPYDPAAMTYHVNMHPALPAPAGKIWISVARNAAPENPCRVWECPLLYRPIFRLIAAPSRFPTL